METTNYIALSRQAALRRELNLVANNMANLNTPAYQGESMMFVEYLADTQRGKTGEMSFVQDLSTVRDLTEGSMKRTENPLDLAISGRGYFTIETEDGPRYTRNGAFQLNEEGQIVNKANQPLLDANGNPIEVPADAQAIEIGEDGTIATEFGPIARLEPVAFENEQLLEQARQRPVRGARGAGGRAGRGRAGAAGHDRGLERPGRGRDDPPDRPDAQLFQRQQVQRKRARADPARGALARVLAVTRP
ncbi:MAG: flagellar hook basal-body protein [Rhodovibrio sp.]|nr:flagellar hook basal-body protein [Rhodovibrio sp.]